MNCSQFLCVTYDKTCLLVGTVYLTCDLRRAVVSGHKTHRMVIKMASLTLFHSQNQAYHICCNYTVTEVYSESLAVKKFNCVIYVAVIYVAAFFRKSSIPGM